uniref:RRM domain-containing protein n=1 Tax=Noccaea caerulescens TaxID=107243 RepID=A0A1J3H8I1_NOCCA
MAPKKRKDSASESETNPRKKDKKEDKNEDKGEDKDKGILWLEKKQLPTGSSPPGAFVHNYDLSSSDEEFEGFWNKDCLLLDVPESTSNEAVLGFFKPFKCNVVSDEITTDGPNKTVPVKFSSAKQATAALEKLKGAPLNEQPVCLTRSINAKYKSFCITGFRKGVEQNIIRQQVQSLFGKFGKIIHLFFPPEKEDPVYMYIALNDGVLAEHVVANKHKVRVCRMMGKLSKSELSDWAQAQGSR